MRTGYGDRFDPLAKLPTSEMPRLKQAGVWGAEIAKHFHSRHMEGPAKPEARRRGLVQNAEVGKATPSKSTVQIADAAKPGLPCLTHIFTEGVHVKCAILQRL